MTFKSLGSRLWREWIRPLALPLLVVAAAKSAIADINFVPTGSMKPTILEGDVVFINKLAYSLRVPFTTVHLDTWAQPERGDLVICFSPEDGMRLVKRVIARPGDTVELRNNLVYLNGARLDYAALPPEVTRGLEPAERRQAAFAQEKLPGRTHAVMALPRVPAQRNFGPVQVPANSYFVMGDNRDNSKDSRMYGFMPRDQIVGRTRALFASFDLAHYGRPRFDRFFTRLD